jgi:hypothetical protein
MISDITARGVTYHCFVAKLQRTMTLCIQDYPRGERVLAPSDCTNTLEFLAIARSAFLVLLDTQDWIRKKR